MIIGVILRVLAILYVFLINFLVLISFGLSNSIIDKIFSATLLVIFIYGWILLIKNNRKYLKLFGFSLPIYYLGSTIYRLVYFSNLHWQMSDFTNLLFLMCPLALMYGSYKLEPVKEPLEMKNVPFSPMQYQGIIVRGFANIIDQMIGVIPVIFYLWMTNNMVRMNEYLGLAGISVIIYLMAAEAIWGQTIGKKIFGIRVMMIDGRKCTILGAILRNVFRMIDVILGGYLLAMVVITFTSKRQRIGDLIARTVVVKTEV